MNNKEIIELIACCLKLEALNNIEILNNQIVIELGDKTRATIKANVQIKN